MCVGQPQIVLLVSSRTTLFLVLVSVDAAPMYDISRITDGLGGFDDDARREWVMRKTVQEWLESHQKGQGMGKKRRGGGGVAGVQRAVDAGQVKAKKGARKKVKRKPR
jgi:hypothetical protein